MQMDRLEALFRSLRTPTGADAMSAVRLAPGSKYRVARDGKGDPVLLLELGNRSHDGDGVAVHLRHFEYLPTANASVWDEEAASSEQGTFMVITCRDSDSDLRQHFFGLTAQMIEFLGPKPKPGDADKAIRDLVELFRAMNNPARRTISGLWAELLVLSEAPDIQTAAAAWHSDPMEEHDFAIGDERVEVKATTRAVRAHEISLDQLGGPGSGPVLVASVLLESDDGGDSVVDLVRLAQHRMQATPEAKKRLDHICTETIGEDWDKLRQVRFATNKARDSLRWYRATDVPSVNRVIPPQVSHVRFTVDLSDVPPLRAADAHAVGALARALVRPEDDSLPAAADRGPTR